MWHITSSVVTARANIFLETMISKCVSRPVIERPCKVDMRRRIRTLAPYLGLNTHIEYPLPALPAPLLHDSLPEPPPPQGCVIIFLTNFLALLIKVDSAGEGSRDVLGGILVAVNVLLIVAVLLSSWLSTQQSVDDHRDGETAYNVAGKMLTFEQLAAKSARRSRASRHASAASSLRYLSLYVAAAFTPTTAILWPSVHPRRQRKSGVRMPDLRRHLLRPLPSYAHTRQTRRSDLATRDPIAHSRRRGAPSYFHVVMCWDRGAVQRGRESSAGTRPPNRPDF